MKVKHASSTRRINVWRFDVEDPVYDHACAAMESRPDFDQIERLWAAINERYIFMRYDYDPEKDEDLLYEMDLTELAEEADITSNQALSHLTTMQGAGIIAAVCTYQEYNTVTVVVAPHMVKKA